MSDNENPAQQTEVLSSAESPEQNDDTEERSGMKVFNDPIHGHIELHPLMVKFIDTPQFQRLRYIKQLGGTYYVFPGASHNRFEHSIGVGYLAGELVETLQRKQPDLNISPEDVLCVKLAGLCHDLGHGPFSHLFKDVMSEENWKHEEASVMMLDHLIWANDLVGEMRKYGLDENDITFIKELIDPPEKENETPHNVEKWAYEGRDESKSFLYEIVANKRTEIDVDKWDYFARDCHHLGIPNSFDHKRFITFARVISVDGRKQICIREKEANNVYDMFHTRWMLHNRAYQHKTTNIIQEMITEVLKEARSFEIPGKDGKLVKMSEAIHDPVAFTRLTDQVLQQIQLSTDEDFEQAQNILESIEKRRIYKYIGWVQNDYKKNKSTIHEEMFDCLPETERKDSGLQESDIVVVIATFDYGLEQKDPVNKLRFYRKDAPNKAYALGKEEVSKMLPEMFMEEQIRVFCKKDEIRCLKATWECFKRWCEKYPPHHTPANNPIPSRSW